MHAIIVLLVTGAVFLLATVVYGVVYKGYEEYKRRYVLRSVEDLGDMFIFLDPGQLIILNFAAMGVGVLLGMLFLGPLAAVILAFAGFFTPIFGVQYIRKKRIANFERQLIDALSALANALKAGLTFPQAMEHVTVEARPPLAQEFGLFVKEIKLGVAVEEGLINMTKRVASEDLDLLVTSTNIARSLGGNMAEMFDTIGATIRERFRLEGRIKAMTSQGKMQGVVVGALPLALGLVINYMRPDLMEPMLHHWFGWILVALVIIFEFIAILFIRMIINIDV